MSYDAIKIKNWRAVFTNHSSRNWWFGLVPGQKHTHCELVGNDGFQWLLVTPHNASIKMESLANNINTTPEQWIGDTEGMEVVIAPRFAPRRPRVVLFSTWTCVEVCKAVLNISCWYVVTPDQLCEYLKQKGKPSRWWKLKQITISIIAHTVAIPVNLILSLIRG